MTDQRDDVYLYIQVGGDYLEKHIYASQSEAEQLERLIKATLADRGFADAHVSLESGGDYHWIVEDDTDLGVLAREIVDYTGDWDAPADQPG